MIIWLATLSAVAIGQSVTWGDEARGDLSWGELLWMDNYTIEAADFSSKEGQASQVLLNVYYLDHLLTSRVVGPGEGFILEDRLQVRVGRITVEDLIQNQSRADVRMRSLAVPELSFILTADRDVYRGGEEIRLSLKAENLGLAEAEDLSVNIVSADLALNESLGKGILPPGSGWKEGDKLPGVDLDAPYLPSPQEIEVLAYATFRGQKGRVFRSEAQTSFRIEGPLLLHKRVSEVHKFGDRYFVSNSLRNMGDRTLQIRLVDRAGPGFEGGALQPRDLEIMAGESQSVSYQICAERPGEGQVIPASKASFDWDGVRYQVSSESLVVSVFGPFLEVDRQIEPREVEVGEVLEVALVIKNTGNRFAKASFAFEAPDGTEMISKRTKERFGLSSGEARSFHFSLRALRPGEVVFSPFSVAYRDVHGKEFWADAPALSASVKEKVAVTNVSSPENSSEQVQTAADVGSSGRGPRPAAILYALVLVLMGYLVFGKMC